MAAAPQGTDFSLRVTMRPDLWVQDHLVDNCEMCGDEFGFFVRRHHCRFCGHIFCGTCSDKIFPLAAEAGGRKEEVRTCRKCFLYLATAQTGQKSSDRQRAREEEKVQRKRDAMDKALEEDLLTAKGYLRGTDMQLESALVAIGHRPPLEKTFYLVRSGDGSRQTVLSMLTAPMPPKCPLVLSSKNARSHFRNFVKEIDHPFIFRAQELAFVKEKRRILVFREFTPRGSLKDRIHRKANPKQRWAAKYGFKGEAVRRGSDHARNANLQRHTRGTTPPPLPFPTPSRLYPLRVSTAVFCLGAAARQEDRVIFEADSRSDGVLPGARAAVLGHPHRQHHVARLGLGPDLRL